LPTLFSQDVADEDAFKAGALYRFPTKTTVGAIFESMHRYVPADLAFQNERQRNGTWLFVSQDITPVDSIHFGWAHAFKAQGDPGQHNSTTLTQTTVDGPVPFAPNDNQADMLTASYKHKFSENLPGTRRWRPPSTDPAPTTISARADAASPPTATMRAPPRAAISLEIPTASQARRSWEFPPAYNGGSSRVIP
jgi:hypothetical protein